MEYIYKYYNKKDWQSFYQNVVAKHWQNRKDIYDHLTKLNIFDDDVCKSIAALSRYNSSFEDVESVDNWLDRKIPALENISPKQIVAIKNGMDSIRVYILRS